MIKIHPLIYGLVGLTLIATNTLNAAPIEATNKKTNASQETPAEKNLLALNTGMFTLYDNAQVIFQRELLDNHPIILSLFSGAGGKMILYRPNKTPEEAPSVPLVYQLLKSTGHSTMAISQVILPFANKKGDTSWRNSLSNYKNEMQKALDGLNDVSMNPSWKETVRTLLTVNIQFMTQCLEKNEITSADLEAFGKKQSPNLKLIISWAAQTQVNHWMGVLDKWKNELGPDWEKTYAASNTIYVARQNNILFSVLAQYFGPKAINDRLFLIETISFTTTPEELLTSVTRIISDRNAGQLFYGNDRIMDYELMGGDARKAIITEMKKRGKEPFLPPLVPFGSRQWPALITPGPGPKTLDDLK